MRNPDIASLAKTVIGMRFDDLCVRVLLGDQTATLVSRVIVDNGDPVGVFCAELLDTVDGINNFFATVVVNQNKVDPRCRLNDVIHS